MPATRIMLIRHAEKPEPGVKGVSSRGEEDEHELVVRGWQRSGALVRYFAPHGDNFADPLLATPRTIFASAVVKHSESLRPQHTVLELATLLKLDLVLDQAKGQEAALVPRVIAAEGPVLVAWEHEAIPEIANLITGDKTTCPQKWPGTRFDLVWVFDRPSGSGAWSFAQVPQLLLSGDSAQPIS